MQLPQPIARLMNEIFSGKNPADLARIGITTITLVLTLLAATAADSSTPNDDGSSNDDPAPEQPEDPGYTTPPAHIQAQLDTIQTEVYDAINDMRTGENLSMIFEYPDRQDAAQGKAELNAVTGEENPVDENISMLQAHLPLNEASGYEFIERLRTSESHLAVLMEPTNLHMAVGVAYSASDDKVWLVLQFE
ncbi:CAP domain-containing protein [Corynebacteriaceae bacterium 6-324]